MSSSGLVLPLASSAREGHDTSYVPMPLDSRLTFPEPSNRDPSPWVVALRVVAMGASSCVWGCVWGLRPQPSVAVLPTVPGLDAGWETGARERPHPDRCPGRSGARGLFL